MEEIQMLHNLNIEWGCITNLMDKISNLEDRIDGGWPELIDMVADAITEEGDNKAGPEALFFNLYQYLFRLYYRLKADSTRRPFNIIKKTEYEGEEAFSVKNYDYTMFKWLKENGFGSKVSNDYVIIPKDKLSDKQRRAFDRKAK